MVLTRPYTTCKPNSKHTKYFSIPVVHFSLSRHHLVHSAPSQSSSQDIPDRIPSINDSQFDFKFNFGGNSVRILVRVGHVVTNAVVLLLA